MNYFIMLFTLFFFFVTGSFVSAIRRLLPLTAIQKEQLKNKNRRGHYIYHVWRGHDCAGWRCYRRVAFHFLGVPSPYCLALRCQCFFYPIVGSFAIWGPVTAYLFISGEIIKAYYGGSGHSCKVGLVEHILKPKIMGNGQGYIQH